MPELKKRPWLKFYPQDWRGDAKLRACSIGARGLWIEMISIMHEAEPYGYLMLGEIAVTNRQLASLAGISARDCLTFLAELGSAGVFSRGDAGMMFSRRMVRDKAKADKDRENGKGGGNPKLMPTDNAGVNLQVKAHIPEARIDRIGSAGAGAITEGSAKLADAFWKALGFEGKLQIPPEFAGVDWRAIAWEQAGWSVELIDAEARRIGPDKPLSYHEKVFATAHAKRNAPLPKVEIREAETQVVHAASRGSIVDAFREIRDEMQSGRSAEAGADPVLRLSSG